MRTPIMIAAALALAACSDSRSATDAVDNMCFSDIETTGYRVFGCGDDYSFHTGFRAKNPKGKVVTGVVCSGWLKGSSVKFD